MKKIKIILPVLLFAFNFQVFSQIKKADKHFKLFRYSEAIPYYLKGVKSDKASEKNHSIQRLAECYRFTSNFEEARKWYEKVVQTDGSNPENYFHLGQLLRNSGLYKEAADAFQSFNKLMPENPDGKKYYQFSVDIQEWLDLPDMAEIKNAETLNSEYSDFAPLFYKNGLIFTSDRKKDLLDQNRYGWTNFGFLNLYFSEPEYSGSFWGAMGKPSFMEGNFNQKYHDGPVCFTSGFDRLYLTRTTAKKGKKDNKRIKTYNLKIYSADIDNDGNISKTTAFPFNSSEYSTGHPALSENGDWIIFSSDMPGGYGGADLYMSTFENGNWTKPVNLGENVNTSGNEVFPYWANDSILFFSSEGHLGYGGLDIFVTIFDGKEWSEPENLKEPINSSYDDFGIVLNENLDGGFFSSNRPEGKGSDDIYAFRNLKFAVPLMLMDGKGVLIIDGFVKDEQNLPVPDATVFLLDPGSGMVKLLKTDNSGRYSTNVDYEKPYIVKAVKDGYIYDCTNFRTLAEGETSETNTPSDLVLKKLEINRVFRVENIYYDLDRWDIREDAKPALDELVQFMKQNPVYAELSSHTDSRASFEYNMELSQKRAESAVRYIILQGVSPSRITAKGYGESRLVNECADGVTCTEEQHQANRRTEFKITAIDFEMTEIEQLPTVVKEGDVISINMFPSGFFGSCKD